MAKKKVLSRGDQTKEERKKVRKSLGTLKSLTVQPKTRERYSGALVRFFNFLSREGLSLPTARDSMDSIVSDYLEWLWSEGEGRSEASNALAA
jgi:site-specific recombinase XerD